MQQAVPARTPTHLWIVGILSLLWNAFGCVDYVMTRMRNTDYLASAMPGVDPNAVLAWIDNFPIYAQVGWGMGVWLGLLGSILLLMRSRWAVWSYGLSLLGAVISLGYQIALAPPLAGMEGGMNAVIPYVIIAVCVALFLYARAQAAKGVLR
ncbi:MAG TPA: hypothetical protein VJ597_05555 [Sphingomicrobium sp.]|nr:hypothetical protein [Sphingomicrobium sp.]